MAFETKTFAAQDALVAELKNTAALSAWAVDFGIPSRKEELHIWVDEAIDDWTQATPNPPHVRSTPNRVPFLLEQPCRTLNLPPESL